MNHNHHFKPLILNAWSKGQSLRWNYCLVYTFTLTWKTTNSSFQSCNCVRHDRLRMNTPNLWAQSHEKSNRPGYSDLANLPASWGEIIESLRPTYWCFYVSTASACEFTAQNHCCLKFTSFRVSNFTSTYIFHAFCFEGFEFWNFIHFQRLHLLQCMILLWVKAVLCGLHHPDILGVILLGQSLTR